MLKEKHERNKQLERQQVNFKNEVRELLKPIIYSKKMLEWLIMGHNFCYFHISRYNKISKKSYFFS